MFNYPTSLADVEGSLIFSLEEFSNRFYPINSFASFYSFSFSTINSDLFLYCFSVMFSFISLEMSATELKTKRPEHCKYLSLYQSRPIYGSTVHRLINIQSWNVTKCGIFFSIIPPLAVHALLPSVLQYLDPIAEEVLS